MALSAEFTDPRLVAVYDTLNPYRLGTQPDFYVDVARSVAAASVIEVGAGTGMVTRRFADAGFAVTAVEPSSVMLGVARGRPGADRVDWVHGDITVLRVRDADFAFMAGHVAQFFLRDDEWDEALRVLRAALRRGGHLAFETRNPAVAEWETWAAAPPRVVVDATAGPVQTWDTVHDFTDQVLSVSSHYRFVRTGEEVVAPIRLRFRTAEQLHRSLDTAGFTVEHVYGDWDRRPAGASAPEFIVVAQAR